MINLIQNETLKVLRRKRFLVVATILFAIIALVTYGRYTFMKREQNKNWRAETQQRIARMQERVRRGGMDDGSTRWYRAEIARQQFYVDNNIDPTKLTAPMFVRRFVDFAGILLLPLLIGVLGSDVVSAENSEGTDKLLLTRPVKRWKILSSKLITLWIFATLTLLISAIFSYCISAPFITHSGWTAPTFSGFQLSDGGTLRLDALRQVPLWKDALVAYGLSWYALICVASIALMLSVLFKSSAASIGTMLATLIGGTILYNVAPEWLGGKYIFVSSLRLADYYTGSPMPYEGMTIPFCIGVLAAWAAGTTAISYLIFTRRDVFG